MMIRMQTGAANMEINVEVLQKARNRFIMQLIYTTFWPTQRTLHRTIEMPVSTMLNFNLIVKSGCN